MAAVRDLLVVVSLSASFATMVTALVTLAYGMLHRPPRWRALVALVAPPLAIYWGFHEKMRFRSVSLIVGALAYAVAFALRG